MKNSDQLRSQPISDWCADGHERLEKRIEKSVSDPIFLLDLLFQNPNAGRLHQHPGASYSTSLAVARYGITH